MKKKIFGSILAVAIAAVATVNVNFNNEAENALSALGLANAEALANGEEGSAKKGEACETERCKLDLGGGMYTSSVERICVTVDDPNSTCTPVSCGEVFYGCN